MGNNLLDWQKSNETFLTAALAWLRLRLEQLAEGETAISHLPSPPPVPVAAGRGLLSFTSSAVAETEETAVSEPRYLTPLETAAARMEAAAAVNPPPALMLLGNHLGLSPFERDTLLLCTAMELDTRIPALCARAQGDPQRP
ncbi:MAG: hypothetical protein KC415_19645 [Anaerolineales bacterium]|nr:hypothetical protein [Anaerolineales bacterium]